MSAVFGLAKLTRAHVMEMGGQGRARASEEGGQEKEGREPRHLRWRAGKDLPFEGEVYTERGPERKGHA